jgi:raffinose/stachyose/melibiose transport system permease protein
MRTVPPLRTETRPAATAPQTAGTPTGRSADRTPVGAGRRRARRRRAAAPSWFVVPALVLYTFVVLVPSAQGAMLAFTDWDGLSPVKHFVGLANFREIFADPAGRGAALNTMIIAVSITIIQNLVGLLLALGVNTKIRSRNVLRVLLFAPAVMTPVVTGYLWKYMYAPDGAINSLLALAGLDSLHQDFLGNQSIVLWSIIGVVVWQFSGYSMVIFLAGLQSVPLDVMEAASVDGAGPAQRFWHVIRPALAPAITVNLMLSIIGGLKLFDQVWVMTGGGPGYASQTLSTLIYTNAFQFNEFGYSIALALVLTVGVAIISSGQYWFLRRQENRFG